MRKWLVVFFLLSLASAPLVSAPAFAQGSLEEIEAAVAAQWDKVQSFSGV